MLGRLVIGLCKGLLVGGLAGFALARLGEPAPGPLVAYLAAAVTGSLLGLVAGRPVWARDARIEAGVKAVAGGVLALGLLYLVRRFGAVPLPLDLGELAAANRSLGEAEGARATLGGTAVGSLTAVSAVLAGFFEADHDPRDEADGGAAHDRAPQAAGSRAGGATVPSAENDQGGVEEEAGSRGERLRR